MVFLESDALCSLGVTALLMAEAFVIELKPCVGLVALGVVDEAEAWVFLSLLMRLFANAFTSSGGGFLFLLDFLLPCPVTTSPLSDCCFVIDPCFLKGLGPSGLSVTDH